MGGKRKKNKRKKNSSSPSYGDEHPKKAHRRNTADNDDEYSLPPIMEGEELNNMRQDSAPRVGGLGNVNRWKRRYAKSLNLVEDQRLASIHRSIDLAQSIMEDKIQQQSQKIKKLMDDIDAQKQRKYGKIPMMGASESWPLHDKKKRASHGSSSLVSSSCPSFAFSSYVDQNEPLGRWVRYPPPRELPSIKRSSTTKKTKMIESVCEETGYSDEDFASGSSSAEDC